MAAEFVGRIRSRCGKRERRRTVADDLLDA
jgi:hypothetical protein